MQKYIDVSGVGNAGKGAMVDLLREMEGFNVPQHSFEFDIFRVPGGILDLHHHLCEDWSPIRSNNAYKEFIYCIETMGANPKWYNVFQTINAMGNRYDAQFEDRFIVEGRRLADSFVKGRYLAFWPYDFLSYNPLQKLYKKIQLKTALKHSSRVEVALVEGTDFSNRVSNFIDALFASSDPNASIVFNNAFEAYNPERSLNILRNSKSIIVVRDPRDVFASGQNIQTLKKQDRHLQAKENDGLNKSFLATDNLDVFIERYRLYMKNVYKGNDPRVLVINFEELVTNYEKSTQRILSFLGLTSSSHQYPKKYFNPSKSIENIGKWKKFSDQEPMNKIAIELKDYLWEK